MTVDYPKIFDCADNRRCEGAIGCVLGMAVGDALGLPMEGLSSARQRRLYPVLRHHFVAGRGMVSDDTEHACMTAQALLASGGDPERFARSLSWRLRFWLLGLPAGIGLATLRSILRLWLGFGWKCSGVFSAGNGPAMRSPILGVLYGDQPERCKALVEASTRLTHTDPKANLAAWVVARAAFEARSLRGDVAPEVFAASLRLELGKAGAELADLIDRAVSSAGRGEDTVTFARSLGLERGVTGYSYHTVPVVLHAWFAWPMDYERAVEAVIRCGGDTDTTAAIVGGIAGAAVGVEGIPAAWRQGLVEWPCGVGWMEALAAASAKCPGEGQGPLSFNIPGQLLRNLFFMGVVLFHGFRRLLPPY